MKTYNTIQQLIEQEKFNECIAFITNIIDNEPIDDEKKIELLSQRGNLYKKLNMFGDALRDFRSIVAVQPDNVPAKTMISIIENILSIENTFYYENAYTDETLFPEM